MLSKYFMKDAPNVIEYYLTKSHMVEFFYNIHVAEYFCQHSCDKKFYKILHHRIYLNQIFFQKTKIK